MAARDSEEDPECRDPVPCVGGRHCNERSKSSEIASDGLPITGFPMLEVFSSPADRALQMYVFPDFPRRRSASS